MVVQNLFNNEIVSNGDKIFYKDLSIADFDHALKTSATHDMEVIVKDVDGFILVECSKCKLICKKLVNSNILIMNNKIIYTTCDENIIKEIIE